MVKYGSDPEVFAVYDDNKMYDSGFINEQPFCIPPVALEDAGLLTPIGGDYKHPIYLSTDEFNIIADGAALEVNLKRGFEKPLEMRKVLMDSIESMNSLVGDLSIGIIPTVNFDYNRFCNGKSMSDIRYAMGMIFGCDPDIDAFDVTMPSITVDATKHPLRYGGGHLHFSGEEFGEYPLPATKLLALTVGNYVTSKTGGELARLRVKYYGKPGKYRETQYGSVKGVEYRTPSNAWLLLPEDNFIEMFDWAERALFFLKNPSIGKKALEMFSMVTVDAVSTANASASSEILEEIKRI